MERTTVEKQIHSRKINSPNAIYNILGTVWRLFMYKKYNVHYTFKKDFRKEPGPYFFISNHASRLDYIFTGVPMLPVLHRHQGRCTVCFPYRQPFHPSLPLSGLLITDLKRLRR